MKDLLEFETLSASAQNEILMTRIVNMAVEGILEDLDASGIVVEVDQSLVAAPLRMLRDMLADLFTLAGYSPKRFFDVFGDHAGERIVAHLDDELEMFGDGLWTELVNNSLAVDVCQADCDACSLVAVPELLASEAVALIDEYYGRDAEGIVTYV